MGELKRLVENFKLTPNDIRKQSINESVLSKTIEATDGKAYKAKAVYTFPISRPDKENLNGRVYTSKLWEKVIKEKQAEGCFGLMDHPEDDGSTKNAWCVWRDLRFSEDKKLVVADAYLFGFWGQQVLEALEAGGSVGLSTSGFGEFKDDDKTLNEETYQLERVADFVLNPSYEVFGHQEDLKTQESVENLNPKMIEKIEGGKRINFDDDLVKVYQNGEEIYKGLEDYEPMKDAPWKWDNTNKWYTYKDMIKVCVENLESSPKSNKEIVMENVKSTVSPSIEEKSLLLNIRSMFKETKQITNIFEQQESYSSLLSYFDEKLSVSGADLKKEIEAASKENDALIHSYVEEHDDLDKKVADLEKKNAELEKELADTKDKLEKAEADLKESTDKLAVVTNENADIEKKYNEACNMLDNFKTYATKQKEIVKTLEAEKNGMVTPKDYKEAIVYSQTLEEELKKTKNELYEAKKKAKKEDDDEEPETKDSDDANDAEGDDDKEEPTDSENPDAEADDLKKVDDKKNGKKESFNNDSIRDYYHDLECRNPKVTLIKQDIMKCRTLLEAQMTYLRLKGLVEESSVTYYDNAVKAQTRPVTVEEKAVKHTALREGWL